jgi:hypothetical protein
LKRNGGQRNEAESMSEVNEPAENTRLLNKSLCFSCTKFKGQGGKSNINPTFYRYINDFKKLSKRISLRYIIDIIPN